jgi:alkanesulfonate monooxygenase SsuD/methylene tetrahydromethanopterin reductase-like flavin-dependent oxidoreductase (luciferase family)
MRYAVYVPNFGPFGEPRLLRDLAIEAESSGWDGFFLWDHLIVDPPIADPWVALAAIASDTRTIRLGPLIVPLPRRRPWKVALEAATLQQVSEGRLILGVGMGVPWDYERFGEPSDVASRAARLEEGADLLRRLLAGERVDHQGPFYEARGMVLGRAEVPIWVGGFWPRRAPVHAARTADGVFPNIRDRGSATGFRPPTLDEVADIRQHFVASGGRSDADVALMSVGAPPDIDVAAYEPAGVTWWLETAWGTSLDDFRHKVQRGPLT